MVMQLFKILHWVANIPRMYKHGNYRFYYLLQIKQVGNNVVWLLRLNCLLKTQPAFLGPADAVHWAGKNRPGDSM